MLVVASLEHSVSFNDGESACPCYYVLITLKAEKDLQCDVFVVIRGLNNWEELGLLDLEQRGRIASCNIEMLSAWLKQQDNVLKKGVPSLSVLRPALQSMGEHESVHHCECVLSLSYRRSRRRKELAQHNHTLYQTSLHVSDLAALTILALLVTTTL